MTPTLTETPAQPSTNGVIASEVYNDTTGLPLAGATIQLLTLNSQPLNPLVAPVTSDAVGRFYLVSAPGAAILQISKAGFTSGQRTVTVVAGRRTSPFDARLTPLDGNGSAISSLAGGTAQNTLGDVSLVIPPFALASNQTLVLTHLSAQGLVAPLPLGWSPVAVVDLNPSNLTLSVAATLSVTAPVGLPANATITVARWDSASGTWLAEGSATRPANGNQLQFSLT